VLLGVSQMLFGTILSLFNALYFRKPINIFCEFIPQVIFLMAIFGYMNFMIVYKFVAMSVNSAAVTGIEPPSILISLINMFLYKYDVDPVTKLPVGNLYDINIQKPIQTALVLMALVCVPCMLFIKPLILRAQNNAKVRRQAMYPVAIPSTTVNIEVSHENGGPSHEDEIEKSIPNGNGDAAGHGDGHGDGEFQFGDVFIHQAIHTIEYCLGSISHTASYLRLWALSLAHAQLSEVLWTMVMTKGLGMGGIKGGIMLLPVFAFWAVLTVMVLLLMEGLSAFLHALRLHWVEFQSKFYAGEGYKFAPFAFRKILKEAEE